MTALRFLVCSIAAAALLFTAAPIHAQETPLTEFYAPDDAHLTVYYPVDWEVMYSHRLLVLGSSTRSLSWYTSMSLMPGQVVIVLEDPARVAEELGTTVEAVADALAEQTPMTDRETVTVQGREAVQLVESDERLHVVFSLSEDQVTHATLVTRAGERAEFESLFFDVLESVSGVAAEPVRRDTLREHNPEAALGETFEGNFYIPMTFDYPSEWFIIQNRSEDTVILSNKDISRREPNAATMVFYITPYPMEIADPAAELEWVMRRYWYFNAYGEPEVIEGDRLMVVYGISYGEDYDEEDEYSYTFMADLIFENGAVWFTVVGMPSRDYDEDEELIFQVLNTVRITD